MPETMPARNEIPTIYKWNAGSVFATDDAWNAVADALVVKLKEVTQLSGKLGESAKTVADALEAHYALLEETGKVIEYAVIAQAVDNADDKANRMYGKMQGIAGQVYAGVSFIEPELLQIGLTMLTEWRKSETRLKVYEQFLEDLLRQQAHVRSAEVEEVFELAPLGDEYVSTARVAR